MSIHDCNTTNEGEVTFLCRHNMRATDPACTGCLHRGDDPPEVSPREFVLAVLESKMVGARDNLFRFNMAFRNYSAEGMAQKYGESDTTPAELIADAEADVAQIQAAIDWVRAAS